MDTGEWSHQMILLKYSCGSNRMRTDCACSFVYNIIFSQVFLFISHYANIFKISAEFLLSPMIIFLIKSNSSVLYVIHCIIVYINFVRRARLLDQHRLCPFRIDQQRITKVSWGTLPSVPYPKIQRPYYRRCSQLWICRSSLSKLAWGEARHVPSRASNGRWQRLSCCAKKCAEYRKSIVIRRDQEWRTQKPEAQNALGVLGMSVTSFISSMKRLVNLGWVECCLAR